MIEAMLVNEDFKTKEVQFYKGDLYLCAPRMREIYSNAFKGLADKYRNPKIAKIVSFLDFDALFKKAMYHGSFTDLIIMRYGGIGDLIALSSIIDYFSDCNIHFITQGKYFAVFEWFVKKPKLYPIDKPIFKNFKMSDKDYRYSNWARYQGEGLIENGHQRNWFELFFDFVGETEPDKEMLRPQLITERISSKLSNIGILKSRKPTLLICNRSTIMMRTCHLFDIINNLPDKVKEKYTIFAYEDGLSLEDKKQSMNDIVLIPKTDLATFLLDCYDADQVICVDTGALHFREGIDKPAIGLYNSFTVDSRAKHYVHTKSFDIKSDCDLQPCFIHEKPWLKFCPKGNKKMFAAPCFDSKMNKNLNEQLRDIFNQNL